MRVEPAGSAGDGIERTEWAPAGRQAGAAADRAAAGIPRCDGGGGRGAGRDALHRDAGAGVDESAAGARGAHGGDRDQPVRAALGAQLGLRRFHGPAGVHRLGGARTARGLRGVEPAARDSQSAAVQHQPVPAELHLLSELPVPGRGSGEGLREVPAGAGAARVGGGEPGNRGTARGAVGGVRAGVGAQAGHAETAVHGVSAGVAEGLGAGA